MTYSTCTCPETPADSSPFAECPDCFFFAEQHDPFRYQLELHPSAATLYLGGDQCDAANVDHLEAIARALPPGVRTLCTDLRGVSRIDLETFMRLRSMLAAWRFARDGEVRLSADPTSVRRRSLRRTATGLVAHTSRVSFFARSPR